MEVEYALTREDLAAFQRYHRRHAPRDWSAVNPANLLTGVVLLLALCALAAYYSLSDDPVADRVTNPVLFGVLGAGLTYFVMVMNAKLGLRASAFRTLNQGRNAAKAFGRRRVSIDAEAVRSVSDFSACAYFWHGIDRFGATSDHLFLYVYATTAVIVPARAFPDDRAFQEFAETARRYYRMGGGRTALAVEPTHPTGVQSAAGVLGVTRRPSRPDA